MTAAALTVDFPAEWVGPRHWLVADAPIVGTHTSTRTQFVIAGGVLSDGTVLLGLSSDGTVLLGLSSDCGDRFLACMNSDAGWALEERPDPRAPRHMRDIWTRAIASFVKAKHATEAELGRPL